MSELRPAAELAAKGSRPFPRESADYRAARTKLLAEEIELRRHIQRVAAMRRKLPDGSEAGDYRFLDADGKEHRFPDLFGRHDTLVTYFWMYGPERERPCPMCTSLLGSLDIPAVDLEQRVALAVIGERPTMARASLCPISCSGTSNEPMKEVHIGQGRSRSGPNIQK